MTMRKWILQATALLLVVTVSPVFADEYDTGLDAYLNGDYDAAQSLWQAAVTDHNDGRAMFNLGLLHEQKKIANHSTKQAQKWFRQSADAGYWPSAYHLARRLLSQNDQDDEALLLIQRASDGGYAPARRHLERVGGLSHRALKSEDWILALDGQRWTIQLLAFNEFAKVRDFANTHDLYERGAFFREPSRGVLFYKLIYGDYDSKEAAQNAREALPAKLRQHGPWLRSVADVQRAIKVGSR